MHTLADGHRISGSKKATREFFLAETLSLIRLFSSIPDSAYPPRAYGSDNNSVSVVVSKDMDEKAQAILMDNFAGQDFMKRNAAPRFREAYSAMSI